MHPRKLSMITTTGILIGLWWSCPALTAQEFRYQIIDAPGAADTVLTGMNDHGVVVGYYGDLDPSASLAPGSTAFVYDGMTFETIAVPDAVATEPRAINNAGLVVGQYRSASGEILGFTYDGDSYETIVTPFAEHAGLEDVNDAGQMVGVYSSDGFSSDLHGFLLAEDDFVNIEFPDAQRTALSGINNAGLIVGTFLKGITSAGFLFPGPSQFSHPNGLTTSPVDLDDSGIVVGTYTTLDLATFGVRFNGFLFDINTMEYSEFNLPGPDCTLSVVGPPTECFRIISSVRSDGAIVGHFDGSDGNLHGYVGTLVPEPDAASILNLALLFGWVRRRHVRARVLQPRLAG